MRLVGVAARIDAIAPAAARHLPGHLLELRRLVAEHHHVRALGQLGVGADRLPAELLGERGRPARVEVVHQHRLADPAGERRRHVPRSDKPELHGPAAYWRRTGPRQDWLKKPFSMSRARSSADTSTLRGVRRNTLSAILCMPPSSA